MSCTCRITAAALKAPSKRLARPVAITRSFASFASTRAAAAASQPAASTSALPESSCPAGTVLKNLNYVKDASDPVALENDQYPAWIWTLTESARKTPGPEADEPANLRHQRKQLKAERKISMKAANALKG